MEKILKLKLVSDSGPMKVEFANEDEMKLKMGSFIDTGGTKNYNQLVNKPSINGTELVGNYDEIDPTVPNWAKNDTKPTYTPEEVGSIDRNDEIQLSDIKTLWDSVFK